LERFSSKWPFKTNISTYLKVPKKDCFIDRRKKEIIDRDYTINQIWSIGGETGWYYGDWLWDLRGFIDKLYGGVGSRRGRTNKHDIHGRLTRFLCALCQKEKGNLYYLPK
jgi:hypothetical protein